MKVRITEVRLMSGGFRVEYCRVDQPDVLRHTILSPAAMPLGHELLRANVEVDMRFDQQGRVISISRPNHLVVVVIGPVLVA